MATFLIVLNHTLILVLWVTLTMEETTLTAAITWVWLVKGLAEIRTVDQIDNAPEEKAQVLPLASPPRIQKQKKHYAHIDMPRSTLIIVKHDHRGCSSWWSNLNECLHQMVQCLKPREHLLLLKRVGVPAIVVYLNKVWWMILSWI